MSSSRTLLCAVFALALLAPGVSRAQDASRESEAEALFEQARNLAAEGRWAEACPKFAASQKADPGAGTLLNLGNCYEQNGQTASAWATFREAAAMAKQQARADWEALARQRAAALEPRLSKVTIVVPKEADVPGLVVTRDGVVVERGAYGAPLPLDPQAHAIEARAPGKVPWRTTLALGPNGVAATVSVPVLASERKQAQGDEQPPAQESSLGPQRIAGIAVGAVGAAGLVIGSVTGVLAIKKEKDSLDKCPQSACGDPAGFQANDDARSLARVSTIAFVAGGVAVAAGAVLYFTAPRARAPAQAGRVRVAPSLDARGPGITVLGAW